MKPPLPVSDLGGGIGIALGERMSVASPFPQPLSLMPHASPSAGDGVAQSSSMPLGAIGKASCRRGLTDGGTGEATNPGGGSGPSWWWVRLGIGREGEGIGANAGFGDAMKPTGTSCWGVVLVGTKPTGTGGAGELPEGTKPTGTGGCVFPSEVGWNPLGMDELDPTRGCGQFELALPLLPVGVGSIGSGMIGRTTGCGPFGSLYSGELGLR